MTDLLNEAAEALKRILPQAHGALVIQDIRSAIKALERPCTWQEDEDGVYDTDCGNRFIVSEGTPAENSMEFCPYCAHRIKDAPVDEEEIES